MKYTALDSKNKPYTFNKTENISFNKTTTKKNLQNDASDKVENHRLERLLDYTTNKRDIVDAVTEWVNFANINTVDEDAKLNQVCMRDAGACIIDGYSNQEWNTNTGKCVFDYIIAAYGNIKGFKTYCNYEDLQDLFNNGSDKDLLTVGVNTTEIKNFCKHFHIPMYALNDEEKVFNVYNPEKKNHNRSSMIFRVSNKHFYPVSNSTHRNKVCHHNQIDSSIFQSEVKNVSEGDICVKDTVLCDDVMVELQEQIKKQQLPKKLQISNNQLVSFWIDSKQYISDTNIELNRELCENMGINYTGQGSGTLLFKIIDETIKTLPASTPNHFVNEKLIEAKKDRTHTGFLGEDNNLEDCEALDITKSYSYSLYNIPKFMVLDFNDEWVGYDYDLKFGLYYVKTDDILLFKGTNIYPDSIIRKAIQENIEFEILYQLIPSKSVDNVFRPVIDKVLEYAKGNTDISKFIVNMPSGMLGKSSYKKAKCFINSDLEQIFSFLNEIKEDDVRVFINKLEDTDFYIYGSESKSNLNENNIPMYLQVVCDNNIRLYDLMKAAGGEVLARKVDCIIGRNFNKNLTLGEEWGSYRESPVPKIINKEVTSEIDLKVDKDWRDFYVEDSDDWKKIYKILVQEGGLLLQGDAGKGKTYVAKQIKKKLGDQVRVIAPTNKAALNIGGATIHSFLKMNTNGQIHPKLIQIIKKKYDYVIIDEINDYQRTMEATLPSQTLLSPS